MEELLGPGVPIGENKYLPLSLECLQAYDTFKMYLTPGHVDIVRLVKRFKVYNWTVISFGSMKLQKV